MTVFLPRSAWTNHGPVVRLTPLTAAPLKGFAIHWPGDGVDHIDATNQGHIAGLLEGERKFHTSGRGWSDIAYQYAIDLNGRVWELRGAKYQSAANGNQSVNKAYGAVTLLLGTKDVPSPEMIQAVREFRQKVWLPRWPKATRIVRHGDLFSTDCPGPHATPLVKDGTFLKAPVVKPPPPPHKPVDPRLTPHIIHLLNLEALKKITREQAAELAAWRAHKPWPPVPPKPTRSPLMTSYVYGDGGKDSQSATAVAALFGLSQVFDAAKAKAAADQANPVLVLGGAATTALGLTVPAGATTVVGHYTVALGANGEETLVRGIAAAKTLGV